MGWRLERIGVACIVETGFEEMRRWQQGVVGHWRNEIGCRPEWIEVEAGFEEMRRWQHRVVHCRNEIGCRPEWIEVGALNRDVSELTVWTSRYLP